MIPPLDGLLDAGAIPVAENDIATQASIARNFTDLLLDIVDIVFIAIPRAWNEPITVLVWRNRSHTLEVTNSPAEINDQRLRRNFRL